MTDLFKKRYRIVTDSHAGYEVQYKYPWWPFWIQASSPGYCTNTHSSIKRAKVFLAKLKNIEVVYYD